MTVSHYSRTAEIPCASIARITAIGTDSVASVNSIAPGTPSSPSQWRIPPKAESEVA
jgi:hypothetical protein